MVGRRKRSRRQLVSSHQRSWLWGRHAVEELLAAGRWRPLELRLAENVEPGLRATLEERAKQLGVPVSTHPAAALTRWCRTAEHQGLLALLPPFEYLDLATVIEQASEPSLLLVLDRIQDPHNFGAILRSAEVFGVDAVIVGEREQCEVTPHVVRSSAGAVHHLRLARVDDLPAAVGRLSALPHLAVVAATGDAEHAAADQDFRGRIALVIGNEGAGISLDVLQYCSAAVRIPQAGRVQSLNAAVAAGVLLYEVRRQRDRQRS